MGDISRCEVAASRMAGVLLGKDETHQSKSMFWWLALLFRLAIFAHPGQPYPPLKPPNLMVYNCPQED